MLTKSMLTPKILTLCNKSDICEQLAPAPFDFSRFSLKTVAVRVYHTGTVSSLAPDRSSSVAYQLAFNRLRRTVDCGDGGTSPAPARPFGSMKVSSRQSAGVALLAISTMAREAGLRSLKLPSTKSRTRSSQTLTPGNHRPTTRAGVCFVRNAACERRNPAD